MRINPTILVLTFASVLTGIACRSNDIVGLTYEENPESETGREPIRWLLESMNLKKVKSSNVPSLQFGDGQAYAYGGCNSGFSDLTLSDSEIQMKSFSVTSMACSPREVYELEESYYRALNNSTKYEVVGDRLVITGPETTLEFQKRMKPKASPLIGSKWNANMIGEGAMVRSLFRDTKIVLLFSENTVTGDFGCGSFTANVIREKKNISINDIKSKVDCKNNANQIQTKDFLARLPNVRTYSINENHLQMFGDGQEFLFEYIVE